MKFLFVTGANANEFSRRVETALANFAFVKIIHSQYEIDPAGVYSLLILYQ